MGGPQLQHQGGQNRLHGRLGYIQLKYKVAIFHNQNDRLLFVVRERSLRAGHEQLGQEGHQDHHLPHQHQSGTPACQTSQQANQCYRSDQQQLKPRRI